MDQVASFIYILTFKTYTPDNFKKTDHERTFSMHFIFAINVYSVSQKKSPMKFSDIFPNGWEFLVQILHAY